MDDVRRDSLMLANDGVAAKTRPARKIGKVNKEVENGGKRWSPGQLRKLWEHRVLFNDKGQGQENGKAPSYQILADSIQKTNTACRIKLHHMRIAYDGNEISEADMLAGKPLPGQATKLRKKPRRVQRDVKGATSQEIAKGATSQKDVKGATSQKDALAVKPSVAQSCAQRKQAAAERRDALSRKPQLSPTFEDRLTRWRTPKGMRPTPAEVEAAETLLSIRSGAHLLEYYVEK